ncbi:outer membrane protein assembly factor BamB family protein [Dictyobacter formicarum]|uniref:Pyrrolo-quinoline quinone repeat domain-containing protein n=1 Tax=Dictyobacter formicarum TaxID=2778368 RepID=A0ABQ3VFZ2_9CHLR|nr:PQQ-binding-like beta-propeller repeat protein [Dictyobacter formicarum]GHO84401.1 hypothetical protein KSZ_24070 [Dictyobacter formicarum]
MAISSCQDQPPAPVVTRNAPGGVQQTLYVSASTHLYAVNASNGAVRWCRQVKSTRKYDCPLDEHCPLFPSPIFGTPKVTNNAVYICISHNGTYTVAFNRKSGSLLWSAQSDCGVVDIPFADHAVPLVRDNIVYSGTYALRAQDGKALWRVAINPDTDGVLSLQALVGNTIYANAQNYVYAIDARNGKILWRSAPDRHEPIGGPLVVSDQRLYVGTLGSVDNPDAGSFYALDADSGKVLWNYHLNFYQGAVVQNETIYIGAQDLYALNKQTGGLLWVHQLAGRGTTMIASTGNVLYINADGAYALNSMNGSVLWHKSLGSSPSVSFVPPVVVSGVVYLASIDGHGRSIFYALNASNGTEYWQSDYPYQLEPLVVA